MQRRTFCAAAVGGVAAALSTLSTPATFGEDAAEINVPKLPVKFLTMAHRGYSRKYPENTVPAFVAAIATGVDSCEFDVYSTKDGILVLSHDVDLKRASGGACDRKITDATFDEVRKVDVGVWKGPQFKGIGVPTLNDVLDLFKGSGCLPVIEIKQPGTEERIAEALIRREMVGECVVVTFYNDSLRKIRELAPGICAIRNGGERGKRTDEEYVEFFKELCKDEETKVANPSFQNWNENTVKLMRQAGFRVGTWVIDDEKTMREQLSWGVDSLTSNDPELLVRVAKELGRSKDE